MSRRHAATLLTGLEAPWPSPHRKGYLARLGLGTGPSHDSWQIEHRDGAKRIPDLEVLLRRILENELMNARPSHGTPDLVTLARQLAARVEPLVLADDCKICETRTLMASFRGLLYDKVLMPWSLGSHWADHLLAIAATRYIHVLHP